MAATLPGSPFVIKELTGQKREFRMIGRGLPYRPYNLKTQQRVELTWLPGSPQATATILGMTEQPTTIQGEWKDKFVALKVVSEGIKPPLSLNNGAVRDVAQAIAIIDDFLRAGQLLEVSWLSEIRRGHLASFDKRWNNQHDCGWTMEFRWIDRGEDVGPATFSTVKGMDDLAAAVSQLQDMVDGIETPEGFGLTSGFVDMLQSMQNTINGFMNSVSDMVTGFTGQVSNLMEAVNGTAATCTSIVETAQDLIDHCESSFGSSFGIGGASTGPQSDGYVGTVAGPIADSQGDGPPESIRIENELFKRRVKDWARACKWWAAQTRASLLRSTAGRVVATVSARSGEDLRDLSMRYYGTPYEWRRIMVFNGKTSIDVIPGETIAIPNPHEAGDPSIMPEDWHTKLGTPISG